MLIKNKVLKNTSWIVCCKIAQSVLSLFIGVFTARYLGPGNYGLINYAASVVSFMIPIAILGLNSVLVREIINSPEKEGEILGTSILMSVFSAIICMMGTLAFSFIANKNELTTTIVCFLYSFLLITQALELIQYWFQSKYKSKYTSLTMLSCYVIVSAYKLYLLVTEKSVYWFALSNALDYFLIAVILFIIYRKTGSQRLSFSWKTGKKLLSLSKYFIISNMMVTIYANTDKVMIKSMMGEEATGLYSAAVACSSLASFVFSAIIDSARPAIFEVNKTDNNSFEKRLRMLYTVLIYGAVLQGVVFTLFSKYIIVVLYGNEYMLSTDALRVLGWHTLFSCLGSVRDIWILSKGKQHLMLIINISGAVANIVLNIVLIPAYGVIGAAIASILALFFSNFVLSYFIKPLRRSNQLLIQSLNPAGIVDYLKSMLIK